MRVMKKLNLEQERWIILRYLHIYGREQNIKTKDISKIIAEEITNFSQSDLDKITDLVEKNRMKKLKFVELKLTEANINWLLECIR